MKLTRHERGQLFIETAAAVAGGLARKFYGQTGVLARLSQDAAHSQMTELDIRSSSRKRAGTNGNGNANGKRGKQS